LEIFKQLKEKSGQASQLHNISLSEMAMGNIRKARGTLSQAIDLSHEIRDLDHLSSEFAYKAFYEFLLGNSIQAYGDYESAYLYFQKKFADQQALLSSCGTQQAELLIRIQASRVQKISLEPYTCCLPPVAGLV
jgi:tetratricopeptide (TPR) repeat protein